VLMLLPGTLIFARAVGLRAIRGPADAASPLPPSARASLDG
jgi:hypothetical protein